MKNIIDRIDMFLREETVSGDVATNTAKGHVTVIGDPKRDGSGKGIRANKGRGGCKVTKKKKKSKLTGKNIVTQR